jgi:hypothetical protein
LNRYPIIIFIWPSRNRGQWARAALVSILLGIQFTAAFVVHYILKVRAFAMVYDTQTISDDQMNFLVLLSMKVNSLSMIIRKIIIISLVTILTHLRNPRRPKPIETSAKPKGLALFALSPISRSVYNPITSHQFGKKTNYITLNPSCRSCKKSSRSILPERLSWFWTTHAFIIRSCWNHFLKENKNRVELVFLPPYSPELNIVEGLWKWLKSDIINNGL